MFKEVSTEYGQCLVVSIVMISILCLIEWGTTDTKRSIEQTLFAKPSTNLRNEHVQRLAQVAKTQQHKNSLKKQSYSTDIENTPTAQLLNLAKRVGNHVLKNGWRKCQPVRVCGTLPVLYTEMKKFGSRMESRANET